MKEELIATCGMNCGLCSAYLAKTHDVKTQGIRISYCTGCRPRNKQCAWLKKNCEHIGQLKYCYECTDFPCKRLQHLDIRYRNLFKMSMIDNLQFIKERGIEQFLTKEQRIWKCQKCGETICCHNGICFNCGIDKLKAKKLKHRWEEV